MNPKDLLAELAEFNDQVDDLIGKNERNDEEAANQPSALADGPARPSIPPMITSPPVEFEGQEDDEELERYTADVREAAEAALREVEAMTPRRLFEALVEVIEGTFTEEMDLDREFFRVRYFIASPSDLRQSMGPFSPVYDEPLRRARWEKLYGIIWNHNHDQAKGQDGPRGIHFVHEIEHHEPDATWPEFTLDISVDARGSIEQLTTEIDLWWTLALSHDGDVQSVEKNLGYAGRLIQAYGTALHAITQLIGLPTARESALRQFFHQMDGLRLAKLQDHEIDFTTLPAGAPVYEFNGQARFRGRDLEVVLNDSTGFALKRARNLHEASLTYDLPLTHFSMGLKGNINTVYFERRFED